MSRANVIGVGMTDFIKPDSREGWTYDSMAVDAGKDALADAGITYEAIEQVAASYALGDSTSGQRAVYGLGLSGVPIINVNNNCSSGSTAIYLARQWVESGISDCVLAIGFEQMGDGLTFFGNRPWPVAPFHERITELGHHTDGLTAGPLFAAAGQEHMERYGTDALAFAKIGEKNHRHSVNNPRAQFQKEFTLEQVAEARMIAAPVTLLQCSPTSSGAAAAVIASDRFVEQHGLAEQAVQIIGQAMTTDTESSFSTSAIECVGADMTKAAAQQVYEQSGLGPSDVDVIELHDCFSPNELISYEGLGLCGEGEGGELIHSGAVTYGGDWVVNPSGGLISKGHPIGATGVAQCAELTWQLRGTADARQVEGAKVGLQHNVGLGGACVVTMYQKDA